MSKHTVSVFIALAVLAALVLVMLPASVRAQEGITTQQVSAENCAVTAFDIAGQGNFVIDGSSGGALPPGLQKVNLLQPDAPALQFVPQTGPESVAILVIDDFFAYAGEVAHGRLVTDLMVEMIRANPAYAAAPQQINAPDEPVIWAWEPPGQGRLLVVEVDTEDYNSAQLKTHVEDAVTLLHEDYGVNRMVFNMSFVLIPCVTPEYDLHALRAQRTPGQSQRPVLVNEVARAQNITLDLDRSPGDIVSSALDSDTQARQVTNAIAQYARMAARADAESMDDSALDPLHTYIQSLTGEGAYWNPSGELVAVAVGSAGNFGRALDSFVPGAWEEVASTSAYVGLRTPWVSSNRGQIMLPGGVFPAGEDYIIGTSFSAPVLSMNMALYLTNTALCSDAPLDLVLDDFRDAPLARAINRQCTPGFAVMDN